MAGILKKKRWFAALNGLFKRQSAFGIPLADNLHDSRVKATVTIEDVVTSEQIFDCDEQDQVGETENSRLKKITISYAQLTAQILLGWLAYFLGSASVDGAAQVNEIQTISGDGVGALKAQLVFEGKTYISKAFAHNAAPAVVQAAFEADEAFKDGSVTVAGASLAAGYAVTFTGRFSHVNLPLMTLISTGLTTGTAAVAQTTAGSNKTHHLTRTADDTLPFFSMVTGFKLDMAAAEKYYNLICDALVITLNRRKDVGLTVTLFGRFTPAEIDAFTVPACVIPVPLHGRDVRILADGDFVSDKLATATLNFNNNTPTDDDAFPFDDEEVDALERGEKPTYPITMQVFGSKGDDIHTLAKNKAVEELQVLIGEPANRVSIIYSQAQFKLAGTNRNVYSGTANKSVIPLEITPFGDDTIGAPLRVEGNIDQTTPMLVSA